MVLEFEPHALFRMRRRQIPERAVYDLFGDYDRRVDRDDGSVEDHGSWDGRGLLAVVEWLDADERDGYVFTVIDVNTRVRRRRRP